MLDTLLWILLIAHTGMSRAEGLLDSSLPDDFSLPSSDMDDDVPEVSVCEETARAVQHTKQVC